MYHQQGDFRIYKYCTCIEERTSDAMILRHRGFVLVDYVLWLLSNFQRRGTLMIKITNFDVGQADCILIHFEKGNKENDTYRYFNILIDGGYKNSGIALKLKESLGDETIQGIVVTHVDRDHISGILGMLSDKMELMKDAFLLFNKYDESLISYSEAKELAEQFQKKFSSNIQIKSYEESFSLELMEKINCDEKFLDIEIMSLGQRRKCPYIDADKVIITVLAPSIDCITRFMRNWHLDRKDAKTTNEASIVLLLEFEGNAILMSGDGEYLEIRNALSKINNIEKIDVMKAAHHGAAANNIGLKETAIKYHCTEIFFTIDENQYNREKKHPDLELLRELKEAETLTDKKETIHLTCSSAITNADLLEYLECKTEIRLDVSV